jgi:hypothetical protein
MPKFETIKKEQLALFPPEPEREPITEIYEAQRPARELTELAEAALAAEKEWDAAHLAYLAEPTESNWDRRDDAWKAATKAHADWMAER